MNGRNGSGATASVEPVRRTVDALWRMESAKIIARLSSYRYERAQNSLHYRTEWVRSGAYTEWATHPIDAKPFHWDPGTSTLAVITTGKQQTGRRFSVTLPIR
jgi:hypothetical protein